MSIPPHLTIYNPDPSILNKEAHFPQFSKLPADLRWNIWECILQQNLMIEVQLIYTSLDDAINENINKESTNIPYEVYVEPYRPTVKLFRVCRESRSVALQFYRVHVPCRISIFESLECGTGPWAQTKAGVLRYNPEYDFLRIRTMTGIMFGKITNAVSFLRLQRMTPDLRH